MAKKAIKKKAPVKLTAVLSKEITTFIKMKVAITAANKKLTAMKSEAHKLEAELMIAMEKMKQIGATVKAGSVKLSEKDVFSAKDWKKIEAHIIKTKDFGVMQKRLSSTLLKEYWDDGVKIKGIEHMMKKSLSHSVAKKS